MKRVTECLKDFILLNTDIREILLEKPLLNLGTNNLVIIGRKIEIRRLRHLDITVLRILSVAKK